MALPINSIIKGDCLSVLKTLPDASIDCIVTSPPYYGLRDYGFNEQIGSEKNLKEYISKILLITAELKRILKPTGSLWWNHGDSYAHKSTSGKQGKTGERASRSFTAENAMKVIDVPNKSLLLQAHRLAIRMIDEQGWILRNQIIWHKPNVMPSSCKDRFTVDFEPIFFFTKNEKYFFERQYEPLSQISIERVKYGWKSKKANASSQGKSNGISVAEMGSRFANPKGRNKRTVWKIPTSGSKDEHVAMFPLKLVEPMILAGSPKGGIVLDPFSGSGTTAAAAKILGRDYIGIELNQNYIEISSRKIKNTVLIK